MGKFGSILDYLIGNVYGSTSIILLVIILIYLYYKNQSKISIVISCLLSSFIMFSIIGIFNPKILVTNEFLLQNDTTKKYIIMHELSHYKRKDLIFNYVILLIT